MADAAVASTFLFTDIEDSTKLWEQFGDAMERGVALHDSVVRHAIEANQGRVFKTIGDAFCAVFATAADGLAAAIEAQSQLQSADWRELPPLRVRIALNTGVAEVREGDYFGPPLNRVARVLSAGHGGQILLSRSTADSLTQPLPNGSELKPLGSYLLRGLPQPQEIYEVVSPGLPGEFPPLRALEALSHNLPAELSSFVGREKELAAVKDRLGGVRLLTLTGSGGIGKTRLALRVAAEVVHDFPDGVWLVELAPLADPELVPAALSSTLGLRELPGLDAMVEALKAKKALIVLDNCEHVVTACAELSGALLRSCLHLKILATSREALGVQGETRWAVPPLSVPDVIPPDSATASTVSVLERSEAVRLFVDRALSAQPGFGLTEASVLAVAQICRRLDGIPLAIELAAARVKVLSLDQIADRLDDRFRLLTSGSRTALPRQQTLAATIDWSYDLLSEEEKQLLRRLFVFAGGFTLEAAEAVCSGAPLEQERVLDLLARLVDRSLVVVHEGNKPRYSLLETIRHYSTEKLLDSGEEVAVRAAHRDWCLALAEEAEPELRGHNQLEWLDRLEIEQDNLRAALEWCTTERAEVESGLGLAVAFNRFWIMRGDRHEGRAILERLLANADAERTVLRARALLVSAALTFAVYDDEAAIPLFTSALALARDLNHSWTLARCLALMALAKVRSGACDATEAKALTLESLAIARETGDDWLIGLSLQHVAAVSGWEVNEGSTERTTYLEEALERHRRSGDRWYIAADLSSLGEEVRLLGDYDKAGNLYEEALAQLQPLGQKLDGISNLINLGYVRLQMGEVEEARARFSESLVSSRDLGVETAFGIPSIAGIGAVAAADGDSIRSAHLLGAAEALTNSAGRHRDPVDQVEFDRAADLARAQLGDEAFATAWNEGMSMTLDEAVSLAFGS